MGIGVPGQRPEPVAKETEGEEVGGGGWTRLWVHVYDMIHSMETTTSASFFELAGGQRGRARHSQVELRRSRPEHVREFANSRESGRARPQTCTASCGCMCIRRGAGEGGFVVGGLRSAACRDRRSEQGTMTTTFVAGHSTRGASVHQRIEYNARGVENARDPDLRRPSRRERRPPRRSATPAAVVTRTRQAGCARREQRRRTSPAVSRPVRGVA